MTKQSEIPGTERTKIPEVEAAAQPIRDALKRQASAAKKIKLLKPALIEAMRRHKIESYRDDEHGFTVSIVDGPTKVEFTENTKVDGLEKEEDEDA